MYAIHDCASIYLHNVILYSDATQYYAILMNYSVHLLLDSNLSYLHPFIYCRCPDPAMILHPWIF